MRSKRESRFGLDRPLVLSRESGVNEAETNRDDVAFALLCPLADARATTIVATPSDPTPALV